MSYWINDFDDRDDLSSIGNITGSPGDMYSLQSVNDSTDMAFPAVGDGTMDASGISGSAVGGISESDNDMLGAVERKKRVAGKYKREEETQDSLIVSPDTTVLSVQQTKDLSWSPRARKGPWH